MNLRRALAAAAAILVLATAAPVRAGGVQAIVAFFPNTYASPVAVVSTEAPVMFVSSDFEMHDVVAFEATRPDGSASWCFEYELAGVDCPLFWSEQIAIGVTEVLGLQDAEPGVSYEFFCTVHPFMRSTLIVVGDE